MNDSKRLFWSWRQLKLSYIFEVGSNSMRVFYFIIITILFSTFFSCQSSNDQQLKREIIGEWIFVEVEYIKIPKTRSDSVPPLPICENCKRGFVFYENQKCEDKLGYFKKSNNVNDNDRTTFIGTFTDYKIENGELKIFDLRDSVWRIEEIVSIISDTLKLRSHGSNHFKKFVKSNYIIDSNEHYDKIIYSSSICFGSCPALNISIEKNGDVLYSGKRFTTINGLYTSKISREEYSKIETNFKKAGIKNLKDEYSANWTDDQTVNITFVKNDRIIKTISDYGRQAPTELYWAYMPVSYLYQKIKLFPFTTSIPALSKVYVETKDQVCELSYSESFYLMTELYKGTEVNKSFKEKYTIDFWRGNDTKGKIYTDGRYFRFITNKKMQTVDLGYNFISRNNLFEKFRNKTVDD